MAVPGLLLLLLVLQTSARITLGTVVTSCASCHGDAVCLESGERDTFTKPELSCVCNEGFVGDGLTCYNTKLCSDSSCCGKGYHWSPERGCVDTDECSLPESPCAPPQLCHNTQGSFECLTTSSRFSSEYSAVSTSVRFGCGDVVCPSGWDCFVQNGALCCEDPCQDPTDLNDNWRSTNNTAQDPLYCDSLFNGQEWYRLFLNNTNARIPEYCVPEYRCGTHAPMWLTGPHPTAPGEIVERTVCNNWAGSCCYFGSVNIRVKLCHGDYYVYKLVQPPTCYLAYCAEPMPQDFHLICGRDKIQIGVNVNEMNSLMLDPFSGNLAVYYCNNHTERDGIVWYEVETRDGICGNILEINGTHIIYSNSLFIYPISSKPFNIPVDFPFSCAYPLDTDASLDVTLKPFLDLNDSITGLGDKARAIMNLYHDSSYTDKYPPGLVTLPVGSPLYVGVTVEESDPRFVAVLEDCYATKTPNPDDTVHYSLIVNQCPNDTQLVSVTQSGTSLQARFTALFFLFQHNYNEVYFHCSLSLCDKNSFSCVPNCESDSRRKRAVSSSEFLELVTIGPIIWAKTPE